MAIKPTVTADVGLDVEDGDLRQTLQYVEGRIKTITKMVTEAGAAAQRSSDVVATKFRNEMKALQGMLGTMRTLNQMIETSQRSSVRNLLSDQQFAKQTERATQYAKTLKNATTATEAFQARLNTIEKQNSAIGNRNELMSRKQERATERARRNLEELRKLDAELARLDVRARRTDGNFTPERQGVASARASLESAALNSRRVNFDKEFEQLHRAVDAYATRLATVRGEQAQALRVQREAMTLEVQSMTTAERLTKARTVSEQRLLDLRRQLAMAQDKDKANLIALIDLEKARKVLIDQQSRAIRAEQPKAQAEAKTPKMFGEAGMTGVLARTAGYAAAGAAIYGVVGVLQQAATASVDFERKLDTLGAIAGSTKGQMEDLRGIILEVSKNSHFSASELAEASTQLAQAGYSASGVAASLKAANDLAIASGSTMAESVDIMTASMGAFQMAEEDGIRVANGLVGALNKSRLAMPQVALGIQYAGVTAHEMNISFEELTASFAAMAQAGVRSGSTMGTGVRQFLTDLQSPTQKLSDTFRRLGIEFEDIDVASIGLEQVLRNLSEAGFSGAEAYASMEKRGAAAYLAMKSQLPIMDEIKVAMSNQTAAADAAATAGDNFGVAWDKLKNRVFAKWDEALQPVLRGLTELINATEDVDVEAESWIEKLLVLNPTLGGLATVLALFGGKTSESAEAMDRAADASAKASETFNATKTRLDNLDAALVSVIQRSGSLKDGSTALQTETLALMNRFQEVAAAVDATSNSYAGLTAAMRTARGEMARQLAGEAMVAGDAARNEAYSQANNIPAPYKGFEIGRAAGLTAAQQQELHAWLSKPINERTAMETARVSRLGQTAGVDDKTMQANRRIIADAVKAQNAYYENIRKAVGHYNAAEDAIRQANPYIQQLNLELQELAMPGTGNAKKQSFIDRLTRQVGTLGTDRNSQGQARVLNEMIRRAQNMLNNQGSLKDPKPERGGGRDSGGEGTAITRQGLIDAMRELIPGLGVGSGGRTEAEQRSIYRKIGKPPPMGSYHIEKNGIGQDFTLPAGARVTKDELILADGTIIKRSWLQQAMANKGYNLDELLFDHPGTGPHVHAGVRKGKKLNDAAAGKSQARIEMSNEQYGLENAARELTARLKAVQAATTDEIYDANVASATQALDDWEKQLRDFTNAEIITKGITGNDRASRIARMEEEIAQKREEFQGKIADGLVKNLTAMFERIEEAFANAMAPLESHLSAAEGMLEGLDMYGVSNRVPSYVRTLAEKRVNEAKMAYSAGKMSLTGDELESMRAAQAQQSAKLNSLPLGTTERANAQTQLDSMTAKILELEKAYARLKAQADAPNMIVGGLSANIRQALEAYRELHNQSRTFAQQVSEEVGPAIDMLKQSFTTFFSDATSGSMSLLSAFGNMAKGIMQYIQQIVAKLVASQLMDLFLGMTGLGGPSAARSARAASSTASDALAELGRSALRPGNFNGGPIRDGVAGRDSTMRNLAKGEYVLRSAAVKSLDPQFLKDLNNHGSRALDKMGSVNIAQPARQEMSVYVIPPEQAPSLSPNDVIVTMNHELMKDGATKRLIKHIAQGG